MSADGASEDMAGMLAFQTTSSIGVVVPAEYETVEYIESHGTEWIDTTVNSSPRINIDLDIQYVAVPQGNTCFFGERVSQGRHFALWASSGNYPGAVINYGNYDPGAAGATGIEMFTARHVLSNREGSMYVDGELRVTCSSYTWTEANNYSLYLFVMRTGGGVDNRGFKGKVYGLKMWERQGDDQTAVLLRDFVPVRRIADNEYGLYDLVEGKFHGNIGSGALSGGEHIPVANSELTVTAEPTEEGLADPAYGRYESLTPGSTIACFAPLPNAGGQLSCSGATVYTNASDDATAWLPWQELSVADGCVTYTHPENSNAKLVWHIAAVNPVGVATPTLETVGINSAELAVNVTGLGQGAQSATVTIDYGVSADALNAHASTTVHAMGGATVMLRPLVPGTTYYARATIDNGIDAPVSTQVMSFAVPAFHEEEAGRRIAYYHVKGVAACDSGVYVYGDSRVEADFTIVTSNPQCRPFTAGEYESISSVDLAFGLYQNGSGFLTFCLSSGGTATTGSGIYPSAGVRYLAILDGGTLETSIINADTGIALFSGSSMSSPVKDNKSLFPVIFGNRPLNTAMELNSGLPIDIKYHSARIYRAGEQVADIIAFRRASDGKVGLYDTFTRRFLARLAGNNQAVFEASPDAEAAGRTILRTALGRDGVTVTLGGDEAAATLYRVSGNDYGGCDPAGWAACALLGAVAADETSFNAALPADWGEGSTMMRFFAVAPGENETTVTNWSETVFWQDTDLPTFAGGLTVDGTGGDTLVVRGVMDSLGGESCTLTVYTGASAENQSVAWTGLAGSTLTEPGEFEFTLFEGDRTSEKYLVPGRTVYVTVEARAGSKVARSQVGSAVLSADGRMTAGTLQITHRDIVAPYAIEAFGAAGVNRVELWAGTSAGALERVAYADVGAAGSGSLAYQFAEFGSYFWQLRYVNATAGGTMEWVANSNVGVADVSDMAVYTWKPAVAEGVWSNAENWVTDRPGDCLGYPQTSKATATFAAGTVAKVVIDADVTCGPLVCTADGLDLTIAGDAVHTLRANVNFGEEFGTTRRNARIVIDGAKIVATGNYVAMDGGMTVELVNGADLTASGYFRLTPNLQPPQGDPLLKIGEGCKVTVGANMDLDSDAVVELAGSLQVGGFFVNSGYNSELIGGGRIRFVGENPQLKLMSSGDQCRSPGSYAGAPRGGFEFVVPAKGYQSVPVVGQNITFGLNDRSQGLVVKVLDESPAFLRSGSHDFPLMSFAGVTTNQVAFQTLKNAKRGSTFLYAEDTANPVWTVPAETTATPMAIGVRLFGVSGTTLIVR